MRKDDNKVFDSILIVEDDDGLNHLIAKRLQQYGYNTISAFNGREALQIIQCNDNILLLTDYILPDMDAKSLIDKVHDIIPDIPFIMATGMGDERLAVEMMKRGALDYITKDSGYLEILPEVVKQAEQKIFTERKLIETEKALRASEVNFRQIVKKSGNGIFVRQNDHFVLVNPSLIRSLEYNEEELLSPEFELLDIIHPQSKTDIRELIKIFVLSDFVNKNLEITAQSKSGKTIHFEITLTTIQWNGKPAILGILTDVTEFYHLKTEMIKAAKNESINILAGGLAHDFNNILSVVLGNLILLNSRMEKGLDVTELINSIEDTIASGTGLTRQLLSFSREDELDTDIISMRQLLKRTVRFTISGSKVRVNYNLQQDLSPVRADRHQIVQVITNLVINAKQAMPDGGDLTVTAINVNIDENLYKNILKPGKYVKVSIRDTGSGIPENLKEKIFEAFFTTKASGQGLGLATCLTILKRHEGWVEMENHHDGGAVFSFYLPSINAQISPEIHYETGGRFSGKILIMDDMKDVRTALKYILDDLGLQTEMVENGEEALNKVLQAAAVEPFDLIIADLTVAGGYGAVKLKEKIDELGIDQKIVVYSGYANRPEIKKPQEYGFIDSFIKPFRIGELKQKLGTILKS
ncbi:MAG: response regulator [Candidatus Marinimicrobia bacterium]|nr:response regulator [Candidatus Neomarinimicrobiota bacterium]